MSYLKKEFGNKYSQFIKWFYEKKVTNGNVFSFVEYKDVYIIGINNIKSGNDKLEFQKMLNTLNFNFNQLKIKFDEKIF